MFAHHAAVAHSGIRPGREPRSRVAVGAGANAAGAPGSVAVVRLLHLPTPHRRHASRLALAGALLLPLLAGPAAAQLLPAPRSVGNDRKAGVQFTMRDRFVDVELLRQGGKQNRLVRRLAWAGISVACKGTNRKGRVVIGTVQTAWPARTVIYRMRLTRDPSRSTRWCVLEYADGSDIAVARSFRKPVESTPASTGTTATSPTTP